MCRNRNQSIWNGLENGTNKPVINCQSYCWWFRNPKQPPFGCFEKAWTVNNGRFQLPFPPSTREFFLDFWTSHQPNIILYGMAGWKTSRLTVSVFHHRPQAKTSTQPRSLKKTTEKLFWVRKSVPKSHKDRQVGGDDQQKGTSSLGKEDGFFVVEWETVFFVQSVKKEWKIHYLNESKDSLIRFVSCQCEMT